MSKPKIRLVIRCQERLQNGAYYYGYKVVDSLGRTMARDACSDTERLFEQALGDLALFIRLLKMGHKLSKIPSYDDLCKADYERQ